MASDSWQRSTRNQESTWGLPAARLLAGPAPSRGTWGRRDARWRPGPGRGRAGAEARGQLACRVEAWRVWKLAVWVVSLRSSARGCGSPEGSAGVGSWCSGRWVSTPVPFRFPSLSWSCHGELTLGDFLSLFKPNIQFIVHLIWNHIFLFNDQPAHW